MLPSVTQNRFPATSASEASAPAHNPAGNRNMFATECSNPSVTKAVTGHSTPRILSVAVRAAKLSQTARQTSALHKAPRTKASTGGSPAFTVAAFAATAPIGPSSKPDMPKASASPTAPIRLPT